MPDSDDLGFDVLVTPATSFQGFAEDFALAAEALRERAARREAAGEEATAERRLAGELDEAVKEAEANEHAAHVAQWALPGAEDLERMAIAEGRCPACRGLAVSGFSGPCPDCGGSGDLGDYRLRHGL